MLTSAEALRCFLETLKDHEESIADLRQSYVPAARVRGPYGCVREAITAVGGFEAARIADGPATVEAYCAKAAKIRERVQCETALKDVVERVDAWVSGRHSDPSQRSRILGDMVSLLLLDAKAERVMRAARRSTIARAGRGVCPPRASGGGAGTRRSGRAHANATHAEGRIGKRTAGGEDSRAPTPFPLPSSPTLSLPPPCPATCRAAPRAAQHVTVVVGAGLGRAAMSRRTS